MHGPPLDVVTTQTSPAGHPPHESEPPASTATPASIRQAQPSPSFTHVPVDELHDQT